MPLSDHRERMPLRERKRTIAIKFHKNKKVFRFNPASQAFPPSHLSIVCKQPLPSVWRRFRFLTPNKKQKSFPFSVFRFPFFANFA